MLSPTQIANSFIQTGKTKVDLPIVRMFLLGIYAGIYIALAGAGSAVAAAMIPDPSLSRICQALVFPAGLVMVILAGSELFTGNSLMILSVLEKKITLWQMLKNWMVVYLGNFTGSMLVVLLVVYSHIPSMFHSRLAEFMIASASAKTVLSCSDAFLRAILCNVLVCVAVWITVSAVHAHGKVIALYLPIVVFVLCGFEHCIANMFCIPAGILTSMEYGLAGQGLSWFGFFVRNLIPVTLGNIVGGLLFGIGYWYIYLHPVSEKI